LVKLIKKFKEDPNLVLASDSYKTKDLKNKVEKARSDILDLRKENTQKE
jgi:hypothetical protein